MRPYATRVDWHEKALVCFERGYVEISLPAPLARNRAGKVTLYEDSGDDEPRAIQPSLPPRGAMRQQAANFVRTIRGHESPMCGAPEALEDLRIARTYIRMRQQS